MFSNVLHTLFLPLAVIGFILLPITVFAQAAGSADPTASSSPANPPTVATSTSATVPATRATSSQPSLPTTPTPHPTTVPVNPTSGVPSTSPQTLPPVEDTNTSLILWAALAAVAILPFGFLVAQVVRNTKPKKEDRQESQKCFNIKKLLDEKLQELTDLRGKLEGKAQSMGRDALRAAVKGTPAGETLALLESAEKEYGRLKKLYEKCIMQFENKDMKKFVVMYRVPVETMAEWRKTTTPEEMKAQGEKLMAEMTAWTQKNEKSIVDKGLPLGKNTRMTSTGAEAVSNDLNFYCVVETDSLEAVLEMFKDNPHLQIPSSFLDIMEVSHMG